MSLAHVSSSLPIEVVGFGRGAIGLSSCPGLGGGLKADLAAIAAFRPDMIVTVMSGQELKLVGRADLAEALPRVASQWHHVPLRAGAAPGAKFERLWAYAGWQARQILRRGGRVLIHCDDGRVRCRWLATRLLGELGVPANEVSARIRMPRLNVVAPADPRGKGEAVLSDPAAGRILGCLLGGAVGDAFGYAVEFNSLARIREKYGPQGLTEPQPREGTLVVSDDTQMTLFTADGLLAAIAGGRPASEGQIVARIREGCMAWFRTQLGDWHPRITGFSQHRALWAVRAPGSTCLSALKAGGMGAPEAPINDSKGSGGVMRVAPLGLVAALDADAAFRLADAAAALTHGHASGRLSAAAFASLISDLAAEVPLGVALDRMEERLAATPGAQEVLKAANAARTLAANVDLPPEQGVAALGEGWTGEEALAIALYAVLRADSFEAALRIAANHDGDSDTTASLAGQAWGAMHGAEAIPHDWARRLDVFEPLCDVAARLIAAA